MIQLADLLNILCTETLIKVVDTDSIDQHLDKIPSIKTRDAFWGRYKDLLYSDIEKIAPINNELLIIVNSGDSQ